MDEETRAGIVAYLKDTNYGEYDAEEELGIDSETIIEVMVEEGFDRCSVCGYWDEDSGLTDDGREMYAHPECL